MKQLEIIFRVFPNFIDKGMKIIYRVHHPCDDFVIEDMIPQLDAEEVADERLGVAEAPSPHVLLLSQDDRSLGPDRRIGRQPNARILQLAVVVNCPKLNIHRFEFESIIQSNKVNLPGSLKGAPGDADGMPSAVVGRHVSHLLVSVDVENKSRIIGERQGVRLVVGGVREGRAVVVAIGRLHPGAQRQLLQRLVAQGPSVAHRIVQLTRTGQLQRKIAAHFSVAPRTSHSGRTETLAN